MLKAPPAMIARADVDPEAGPAPHLSATAQLKTAWRKRAEVYNSAYPGPLHWVRAINVIAATGSLPLALREANVSRVSFNQRRERYPEFAVAIDEANAYFRQAVLEHTAVSRAVDGWLEPVFHEGEIVGYKKKFSDSLLAKLLEGNDPEKFKPRTEVNLNAKMIVEGGLPEMPLTEADVPPAYKTIEHEPQTPALPPAEK